MTAGSAGRRALGINLRPKSIVRFDSMNTAAEAAEHGVGVALVSSRSR